MNEILYKEGVATLLDCEISTVEEKARNGELPAVKIGRSWIFPREALLQRLNELALKAIVPPKKTPAQPAGVLYSSRGKVEKTRPDLSGLGFPSIRPTAP